MLDIGELMTTLFLLIFHPFNYKCSIPFSCNVWQEIFASGKKCRQTFQKKLSWFYFVEWMHDARTTPLSVGCHTPHMTWQLSKSMKQKQFKMVQGLSLPFVSKQLHLQKRQATGLSNRRNHHCWSRFWQLQSVSYGILGIFYSSRLLQFYSSYLRSRTT